MSQGHDAESNDWSDLERRFFEAAPPDVPIPPAAALSFEDLDSALEAPKRPVRAGRPRRERRALRRDAALAWSTADRAIVRLVEGLARAARPAAARAGTWARHTTTAGARGLGPILGRARAVAIRTLGSLFDRFAAEIPGERPEARTVVAALVTVVVVLGLSASVLGSRGGPWLAPPTFAASAPVAPGTDGADPKDVGPTPDLKCPAALPPTPVAFVQPLEPELRRHVEAPAAKRARHVRRHVAEVTHGAPMAKPALGKTKPAAR